jgi:hypothetical protein
MTTLSDAGPNEEFNLQIETLNRSLSKKLGIPVYLSFNMSPSSPEQFMEISQSIKKIISEPITA